VPLAGHDVDIASVQRAVEALLIDPGQAAPESLPKPTALDDLCAAALAAAAAKHLAVSRPSTLGVVGLGRRSTLAIRTHRALYGDALSVRVADSSAAEQDLLALGSTRVTRARALACEVVCVQSAAQAAAIAACELAPGSHIGLLSSEPTELDADVLARTLVYRTFGGPRSLSAVARGERLGREGEEITLFYATPNDSCRRAVAASLVDGPGAT